MAFIYNSIKSNKTQPEVTKELVEQPGEVQGTQQPLLTTDHPIEVFDPEFDELSENPGINPVYKSGFSPMRTSQSEEIGSNSKYNASRPPEPEESYVPFTYSFEKIDLEDFESVPSPHKQSKASEENSMDEPPKMKVATNLFSKFTESDHAHQE